MTILETGGRTAILASTRSISFSNTGKYLRHAVQTETHKPNRALRGRETRQKKRDPRIYANNSSRLRVRACTLSSRERTRERKRERTRSGLLALQDIGAPPPSREAVRTQCTIGALTRAGVRIGLDVRDMLHVEGGADYGSDRRLLVVTAPPKPEPSLCLNRGDLVRGRQRSHGELASIFIG